MVDDKNFLSQLDRVGYRDVGITLTTAQNAESVVSTLKSKPIDLVVLNLDYLQDNAAAICYQTRTSKKHSDIPIIVTSVLNQTVYKEPCLQQGADLFILQPIPRAVFVEKIKSLLNLEVREDDRISIDDLSSAEIFFDEHKNLLEIVDISSSGILLRCEEEYPIGHACSLTIRSGESQELMKFEGEIVRNLNRLDRYELPNHRGVGIKFVKYIDNSKKILKQIISKTDSHASYYL